MTYGEYFLPGSHEDEVLIYTHVCHPSMANDNLSGIGVLVFLAKWLKESMPRRRLSYRFVLAPGNVGAIAWLAFNEERVRRIQHGLVLACLGGPGPFHYKQSRRGSAVVDRAVQTVLRDSGEPYQIRPFNPYGYAERQFCSPGFDLPVGCFMRTPHSEYPEYHTSADDLDYIRPELLGDSWSKLMQTIALLDQNRTWLNQNPKCEPYLGKRGLYGALGGEANKKEWEMALLWVLNLSDGSHSLLDIAERSGMKFGVLERAADALEKCGLLKAA
jgi:aminopeptidase-like protein